MDELKADGFYGVTEAGSLETRRKTLVPVGSRIVKDSEES